MGLWLYILWFSIFVDNWVISISWKKIWLYWIVFRWSRILLKVIGKKKQGKEILDIYHIRSLWTKYLILKIYHENRGVMKLPLLKYCSRVDIVNVDKRFIAECWCWHDATEWKTALNKMPRVDVDMGSICITN